MARERHVRGMVRISPVSSVAAWGRNERIYRRQVSADHQRAYAALPVEVQSDWAVLRSVAINWHVGAGTR